MFLLTADIVSLMATQMKHIERTEGGCGGPWYKCSKFDGIHECSTSILKTLLPGAVIRQGSSKPALMKDPLTRGRRVYRVSGDLSNLLSPH